jgi:hypothetical protein
MNSKTKESVIKKETVISLLRSLPDDGLMSVGMGSLTLTRDQLIEHIEKDDEIGKKIVDIYMNYLRSLKGLSK